LSVDPDQARSLVRRSYDSLGETYSRWAAQNPDPGRAVHLDLLRKAIPSGSRVLDLGCGDGSQVTSRLTDLLNVTGVDISPIQVKQARRRVPSARFICADVTSLELPNESFDAVVAFYSLTHIPQADLPQLVNRIATWLAPGGTFIGSFGTSSDPGSVQRDWLGVPMFFSGFAPETNRELLTSAGLEIKSDRIETTVEFGQPLQFHWLLATKPPDHS
jgi:ubiquinone/menaquinone biosynthesis C-methylase UbiE